MAYYSQVCFDECNNPKEEQQTQTSLPVRIITKTLIPSWHCFLCIHLVSIKFSHYRPLTVAHALSSGKASCSERPQREHPRNSSKSQPHECCENTLSYGGMTHEASQRWTNGRSLSQTSLQRFPNPFFKPNRAESQRRVRVEPHKYNLLTVIPPFLLLSLMLHYKIKQ